MIHRGEKGAAGDRRRDEGQVDTANEVPAPGAERAGGLLEGGVYRTQGGVGHEVGEGKDVQADDEDHAAHAEDVERASLSPVTACKTRLK